MCLKLFLRHLINFRIIQSIFRVGINIVPKLAQTYALPAVVLTILATKVKQHLKKKEIFCKGPKLEN